MGGNPIVDTSVSTIDYRDNTHFYKYYGDILNISSAVPVHLKKKEPSK